MLKSQTVTLQAKQNKQEKQTHAYFTENFALKCCLLAE